MSKKRLIPIIGVLGLFLAAVGFAEGPDTQGFQFYKPTQEEAIQTKANLNNWSYWMRNDGLSGRDPFTSGSGGTYPRGTAHVIFQDGFIYGGVVNQSHFTGNPDVYRVGGQTYVIGTTPGHITTAGTPSSPPVASDPNAAYIYRIRRDWRSLEPGQPSVIADAAEVLGKTQDAVTTADQMAIIDGYEWSWNNWPVELGAPYYDVNDNGQYDPGTEVDLNGDGVITVGEIEEPGLAKADQVTWFVYNDLNAGATTALYGSQPIGIEVQTTAWTYNQPAAPLGQVIFKRYLMINKSGFPVDSMFVAQWCDPDVGVYTDDLVGVDPSLSLGFAYSGNLTDADFAAFGLPPASVGYDFFQGPIVPSAGDTAIFGFEERPGYRNLPQYSFGYFAAGSAISDPELGEYDGTLEWYNLLNGNVPTTDVINPTPFTHGFGPNAGEATKFPVDGDPVAGTGDLDGFGSNLPPGDRRMSLSSGPFDLETWEDLDGNGFAEFGEPGVQEVVLGIVGGIVEQAGGNNRNAVAQLKLNDLDAQLLYDALFEAVPSPPPAPIVKRTPLEDGIVLDWYNKDRNPETEAKDPLLGFHFEGYNVYQFSSEAGADRTKIATFDLDNTITTINGLQFVPEFGDVVKVPTQKGTNTGIQRHFVVDRDFINDRPLFPGNRYFFAVTAYNAKDENNDGIVEEFGIQGQPRTVGNPALESSLEIFTVIPQSPEPGTQYNVDPADMVEVTKAGPATASTEVLVVDPKEVTGHDYRVEFNAEDQYTLDPILDSLGNVVDYDTLGVWHTWNLVDAATGNPVLEDQRNLEGGMDYPIVDGIMARVMGPKTAGLAGWDYEGNRWITGVNWGGAEFFGGLDMGFNFFGSELGLTDMIPVQMVFQDSADVAQNGYISEGAVYRRDLGYAHNGIAQIPFTAWDVSDADNPRRLNICIVEDENQSQMNGVSANQIWDMAWNPDSGHYAPLGGREYVFLMNSDYNGGVDYDDVNWGPAADVLYAFWPDQRGSRSYLLAEFTMDIFANIPNSPADQYTFTTAGLAPVTSQDLAKKRVERINVFPNPYYAFNPEETSRFNRFVTFTHLPANFTIRIFTISGVQVRKLTEEDVLPGNSQFLRWDLLNESNLPVASGMYIAHIDMPDLGEEKILKVFIIQGEEILRFF